MVLHSQRSLSPLRRRHRPPALINPIVLTAFTAGFAVALVFSTYATMIGHLESGRRGSTMYADELPDHSRSAQLFNWHWGRRKRILAFVGVQTGFTTSDNPKYDYTARRNALRSTWFPSSTSELNTLESKENIVTRFIIGHSLNEESEASLAAEEQQYGGFLRLPIEENYKSLTLKTLAFLKAVTDSYDARYIIKVDDDIYLRMDRVPAAVAQWNRLEAEYIGCMKTGQIFDSPTVRWYEPNHDLLGTETYFTHAWGSIYALSGGVARDILSMRTGSLRFFANEDVTLGAWMLALNVSHFDDRRLCQRDCTDVTIAAWDMPRCAGLCDPVTQLPALHDNSKCHTPIPEGGLRLLPQVFLADGELPGTKLLQGKKR